MKIIVLVGVFLSLMDINPACAETKAISKFYRGLGNVITAPIEIPKQARAYWIEGAYKTDHILVWVGTGAVWGIIQGIKRTGSGVWDILSFPFGQSNDYAPLLKPDYVFQEWPRDPDVFIFKKK